MIFLLRGRISIDGLAKILGRLEETTDEQGITDKLVKALAKKRLEKLKQRALLLAPAVTTEPEVVEEFEFELTDDEETPPARISVATETEMVSPAKSDAAAPSGQRASSSQQAGQPPGSNGVAGQNNLVNVNCFVPPAFSSTIYDGREGVSDFLKRFQGIIDANHWNDETILQFFPLQLQGSAKDFYESHLKRVKSMGDFVDWKDLKLNFKAAFKKTYTPDEMNDRIKNIVKKADESVQGFYFRLMRMCERFDKHMTDENKIIVLLKCLESDIALQVTAARPSRPEQVLEQLVQIEKLTYILHPRPVIFKNEEKVGSFRSLETGNQNEDIDAKILKKLTELNLTKPPGEVNFLKKQPLRRRDFPPGRGKFRNTWRERKQESKPPSPCPRCGKGFHWARDCRTKPDRRQRNDRNQQGRRPIQCYYCKDLGHRVAECPQRQNEPKN